MKKLSVVFAFLAVLSANAQIGITAGASFLNPFGGEKVSYPGLGFGVEFATDDQSTIYFNLSLGFPKKYDQNFRLFAVDGTVSPQVLDVTGQVKNSMFSIEGGNRRYLIGDAFDYGFGLYGGTSYQVVLGRAQFEMFDTFDDTKYTLTGVAGDQMSSSASIFSGGIGLHLGLKHQFAFGVLFIESSVAYHLLFIPSSQTAADFVDYSNLHFRAMLGYRKDIWN